MEVIAVTLPLGWKYSNLPKLFKFTSLLRGGDCLGYHVTGQAARCECYDKSGDRPIHERFCVHYFSRGPLGWLMKQRSERD